MEPIKKKSELYRFIKSMVEGKLEESRFPSIFSYCEGKGKPLFTFNVERRQEDFYIDENGQKWVKAE